MNPQTGRTEHYEDRRGLDAGAGAAPHPARYRCGRCGKTMGTETEPEGRRNHWAERQSYPGCAPSTAARNAQCQADALPNGFR